MAFARRGRGRHIITTTVEHPAILIACDFLDRIGYDITHLEVDDNGWVSPENLRRAIREDTILVSIMMANNEVGTVLPIRELCSVAHEKGMAFHTDAVQSVGKIEVDVEELNGHPIVGNLGEDFV